MRSKLKCLMVANKKRQQKDQRKSLQKLEFRKEQNPDKKSNNYYNLTHQKIETKYSQIGKNQTIRQEFPKQNSSLISPNLV